MTAQDPSTMGPSPCTIWDLRDQSDSDMPCRFFFLVLAASTLLKETAAEAPMTACIPSKAQTASVLDCSSVELPGDKSRIDVRV